MNQRWNHQSTRIAACDEGPRLLQVVHVKTRPSCWGVPRCLHLLSVACLVWLGLPWIGVSQTVESNQAAQQWRQHVLPVLEHACLDCHQGDTAEGSLDLSRFVDMEDAVSQRRLWGKIATRVRDFQMPPPDSHELSDERRQLFLKWVDETLPALPCQHPHHAGAVTIRRLTRYEYANTIRDLLGIEFSLTDTFPVDEVGYGFDNMGDVLSVSPLLLEKYLVAAELISQQVIFDPKRHQVAKTVSASELPRIAGSYLQDSHLILTTGGTLALGIEIPIAGRYRISVTTFGQRAGKDLPELAISTNGKVRETVGVKATDEAQAQNVEVTARLRQGRNQLQFTFTNDYYDPTHEDPRERDRNLAVVEVQLHGPTQRPPVSAAEQAFLFQLPQSDRTLRQCAEAIVTRHASRAFRRPITDQERDRLLQIFEMGLANQESFAGAMQLVLQTILVSPHFLYRIEAPLPGDGSLRHLSDHEMATALSYLLWSSMPDDTLFALATRKQLMHPAQLEVQVRRMLQDPKSIALIDNFVEQWLQLRVLEQADPDPGLFPGFTDHLRRSMLQETKLLFQELIQQDLPLQTLLTADFTFVNKALARHYGWSTAGLREREFSRVSLEGRHRQGLLSHASILTLTSNPTRTSPVKRGKWILENLLADPPPPALADVPQLDSQTELKGTLRERMEQHRSDPNCASCHYKMDSLGFALENFDALGRYRELDDGLPIDSAGELPNGVKFVSPAELQNLIARDHQFAFVRCLVEKLFVYALGRGPTETDQCLIEKIARRGCDREDSFADIVLAVVTCQAFQARSQPVGFLQKENRVQND